ncbi:MAG: hypothetical protein FJ318_08070 [SAR202 cluster bacterium]|nr:hypothetical protein [SAR202 cluster bacterium]
MGCGVGDDVPSGVAVGWGVGVGVGVGRPCANAEPAVASRAVTANSRIIAGRVRRTMSVATSGVPSCGDGWVRAVPAASSARRGGIMTSNAGRAFWDSRRSILRRNAAGRQSPLRAGGPPATGDGVSTGWAGRAIMMTWEARRWAMRSRACWNG